MRNYRHIAANTSFLATLGSGKSQSQVIERLYTISNVKIFDDVVPENETLVISFVISNVDSTPDPNT